jgi:hypothetical protein
VTSLTGPAPGAPTRGWTHGSGKRHERPILFAENPGHPSLRFKKPGGYDHVWSVRINEQYRAVGERRGDTVVWVWIGSHNEFDNLFG